MSITAATSKNNSSRQLTVRACIAGMLLGGVMCLANLYVGLKTGWGFGVSITAGILAYSIFAAFDRLNWTKTEFKILENNAMQSVASAAGYTISGANIAAIPALMMITGNSLGGWQMFFWIISTAALGVVMAIPMKQQMINIENLKFPSGIAAAQTLRALHGRQKHERNDAKLYLGVGSGVGAVVAFFRDAHARWILFNIPERFPIIPGFTIQGRPLMEYTLAFDGSLILVGAGAIMGFRAAWSMLAGALINYGVLAPYLYSRGIIDPQLGYRNIINWSVWFGSTMLLTTGLTSFGFQWRSVAESFKNMGSVFRQSPSHRQNDEVPMQWFFTGVFVISPFVIFLEWFLFAIPAWMGLISILLSFFTAIVACRATGETNITPIGALGKITQLVFGALAPGNLTANLMTACVTGGVGLHAADLLTDLKSGYILKAKPKQQFWAQFFGIIAGSIFVVPAFKLLIPDPSVLGTEKWPAPAAQTWKGVAILLAHGFETLHPTARLAIVVGGLLGIIFAVMEVYFPKTKTWLPSPTSFALGFTMPGSNSIAFFVGAAIATWIEKRRPKLAEKSVVSVSSGFIAGESLMGVLIAALVMLGWLESS